MYVAIFLWPLLLHKPVSIKKIKKNKKNILGWPVECWSYKPWVPGSCQGTTLPSPQHIWHSTEVIHLYPVPPLVCRLVHLLGCSLLCLLVWPEFGQELGHVYVFPLTNPFSEFHQCWRKAITQECSFEYRPSFGTSCLAFRGQVTQVIVWADSSRTDFPLLFRLNLGRLYCIDILELCPLWHAILQSYMVWYKVLIWLPLIPVTLVNTPTGAWGIINTLSNAMWLWPSG